MGERRRGRNKSLFEVVFSQVGQRKERRLCANKSTFSNEALFLEGCACFVQGIHPHQLETVYKANSVLRLCKNSALF